MKQLLSAALASVILIASCRKEGEGTGTGSKVTVATVRDLPADTIIGISPIGQPFGAGKFTFYSLERNEVVPSVDSATRRWDIGLRGTTLITNSGNSGPGLGGAFVFVGLFDDLVKVPADSVFRTDNAPAAYAIPAGSNRAWFVYNPQANLVTPIPGRVLVIRTAGGKYAKVEILNYYKGGQTPAVSAPDDDKIRKQRFYTFRFAFQPDGSATF
jgi:hypothetical protein